MPLRIKPARQPGHSADKRLSADVQRALIGSEQEAAAAHELFALAVDLDGALSGEHGIGTLKRAELVARWSHTDRRLRQGIKNVFDPKGLINPGKLIG
jgi:glycolate oxidase